MSLKSDYHQIYLLLLERNLKTVANNSALLYEMDKMNEIQMKVAWHMKRNPLLSPSFSRR